MKPFITPVEMNKITEDILVKAGISILWQGAVERIDIDSLIEFEYDLDIVWEDIDHFSPNGIVLAAIIPQHKQIYMNETKKQLFEEKIGTLNFSKAHELGHWVLHVTEQQDYEQLVFSEEKKYFCRSFNKKPPEEIQADMFAGSILMPQKIVCGAVNELKEQGKVSFPDLYNLKDEFEVSISALVARIKDLNLLYIDEKGNIFMSEAEAMGQSSLF